MNKNPNSLYKIRFNDCDMFGHLNNAKYIEYLVNARLDHLHDYYGFDDREYYKKDIGWVIGSHEIFYLIPAFYNERVVIQSTLLFADSELLYVEAMMMNESKNQLKAIMRSKLVPVNLKTGKKELHLPEFMNWVKPLVNTDLNPRESLQDRVTNLLMQIKKGIYH